MEDRDPSSPDSFSAVFGGNKPFSLTPLSARSATSNANATPSSSFFQRSSLFDSSPIATPNLESEPSGSSLSNTTLAFPVATNAAQASWLSVIEEEEEEELRYDENINTGEAETENDEEILAGQNDESDFDEDGCVDESSDDEAALQQRPLSYSTPSASSSALVPKNTKRTDESERRAEDAKSGRLRGGIEQQRQLHFRQVSSSFWQFECKCNLGVRLGRNSCLDAFNKMELMDIHCQVYGPQGDRSFSIKNVLVNLHQLVFPLRERTTGPDGQPASFHIKTWKLCGKEVCRQAFFTAVGGTENARRTVMAWVKLGISPTSVQVSNDARRVTKELAQRKSKLTSAASAWWVQHLKIQDWLPNEHAIQYRGLPWSKVYVQLFKPEARKNGCEVGFKQWKRALPHALAMLQAEFYPTWKESGYTLKLVRSARHSKFPECNECQKKKAAYQELVSKLSADPALVKQAYADLEAHMKEWKSDRERALNLRHWANFDSDTVYQCDDKCGSYWQRLPIGQTGRDTKENAKAVYHFCIQANVIAGTQGLIRFAMVPQNVKTGANFGFTNLLMTLRAYQAQGKLAKHKTHLIRHTDGGPDNVSVSTHILHWLLVYVGVFQKVTWFRFKAGHSHTEIADRLFSIMKRLFESDNQSRVNEVQDFPQLILRLEEEFRKEKEQLLFEYNFANWDLHNWIQEQHLNGEHTGISKPLVYQYVYDPKLKSHGCVKVQYKSRVSWTGNAREAEWSPIKRVDMMESACDGEGFHSVQSNVSEANGLFIVRHPPNLTFEPKREDLEQGDFKPADAIGRILDKRENELRSGSILFWKSLENLHWQYQNNAQEIPGMPYVATTDMNEQGFTFNGSPQKFLPILKELIRFPRCLPCAQDFDHEPPSSWAESVMQQDEVQVERPNINEPAAEQDLRDPRMENSVSHEGYRAAQVRKARRAAEQENFSVETPARVEDVKIQELYLLELNEPECGLRLGLGRASATKIISGERKYEVEWFALKNCNSGWLERNPSFTQYKIRGKRETDWVAPETFRLHVLDSDLTQGSRADKFTEPKLTQVFRDMVFQFATEHNLGCPPPSRKRKAAASSSRQDDTSDAAADSSDMEADNAAEATDDGEDEAGDEEDEPEQDACPPGGSQHQEHPIGNKDPILILHKNWLDLIVSGKKTLEIRGRPETKNIGKYLWLCATGTFKVYGKALLSGCKEISASEWDDLRNEHQVPSRKLPYAKTFGWQLADAQSVDPPITIGRNGAQIVQYGPHGNPPSNKNKKK